MVEISAENTFLSIFVALAIALTSTFAGQFAKSALTLDEKLFSAPYSMTYLNTLFMIPLYPIYLLIKKNFTQTTVKTVHKDAVKLLEDRKGSRYPNWTILIAGLIILAGWIAPNYIFVVSLKFISVSAATSINSLNAALVFIISIIWLKEAFSWFKACGVLLSIAGVVLVSMDSNFTGSITGVILVLSCALCIALYNTTFKKVFGDLTFSQVLFFLSLLGLTNLIFNTLPAVLMIYFDLDRIVWTAVPWTAIFANALLATLFNISVNFGIAILNPLVVSIGILMGIPISAAVDILLRDLQAGLTILIGGVLISLGFCLNTLPFDEWIGKRNSVVDKRKHQAV
ncbi:unnamed protein product [Bursaphelenchus xylophilus]|uniref:(pine wood nematode) hypothetical protein n=1 Tax=Bursaphelenchus xylophilus TaxID=6326 RepID=A0A7I8XN23_BURXY|nr:unnamed protein product [Bursaphelenchus xylophilus]CAG9121661.1 unnamed protein product [Bursaphelenchus xylophilus]